VLDYVKQWIHFVRRLFSFDEEYFFLNLQVFF
jgi:hypothetical protein